MVNQLKNSFSFRWGIKESAIYSFVEKMRGRAGKIRVFEVEATFFKSVKFYLFFRERKYKKLLPYLRFYDSIYY